ncbi:hypothetical protein TH8_03370 [Thalassospira profundimaris]|nr:hypothetical protein TH8_03370 [Thalassospira profundimaris]
MRIAAYFPKNLRHRITDCATGKGRLKNWINAITALFAVTLISISTIASAQNTLIPPAGNHETITLACNPFPPAKIADKATEPGYDVEILRAAFATRNITLLTPFYPWKRAYFLARTGQVDGLCSCSYLPEREADFLFSDILGHVRVAIYSTRDEVLGSVETLADARDMTVGVVNGYNLETAARKAGLDIIMANSETTLVNLLLSKRLDAALSFRAPMDYVLNVGKSGATDIDKIKSKILSNDPYYSCISRTTEHASLLLAQLNVGLSTIRKNGLYDKILAKYGILSEASQ